MLKDKAVENLAAGDLLFERGHVNAAASRYYYAMYQAAVFEHTRRGRRPGEVRSGAVDWDHSMVENNTRRLRQRLDDRMLYGDMRRLRTRGDYGPGDVLRHELEVVRRDIVDFVRELAR